MTIKKKSKETLEQQKNSFLNFVGTQKKYESIIAELFLMDNEKIDDIEYIKTYLTGKGIDKELIDNFEVDYRKYLGGRYFYGPIEQYPPELQNKIIENNKKLKKLKREIMNEYNKINDFELIVSDRKFEEFLVDEIGCKELDFNSRDIDDDISNIEIKIKENNDNLESLKQNLEQKEKECEKSNFLSFFRKNKINKLKMEINSLKDAIAKLEYELSHLSGEKDELYKLKEFLKNGYDKNLLWEFIGLSYGQKVFNESFHFSETGKNNYKEYCKDYLSEIKGRIKMCSKYMTYEDFKNRIINILCCERRSYKEYDVVNKYIEMFKNKINEYLNYFFFGEDKKIDCISRNMTPSIFSGQKIDEDIWNFTKYFNADFNFDGIDERFINDLFIHRSSFGLLDEILKEGYLISHNEIMRRRENPDIAVSETGNNIPHKDVYFTRLFNQHNYGNSSGLDDAVFFVNTMQNFALNGYGVPLNLNMQKNGTIEKNQYSEDRFGFSIISKSSLDSDGYGKVDLKDLFIFVPEYKKLIIETLPEYYPVTNARIIYIPEEYYTTSKCTYKIYEFIEKQMEQYKQNKRIVPSRIIGSEKDSINSISSHGWNNMPEYLWAFCTEVGDDIEKNIPNLLGDGNIDNIINLLKNCSKKENKMFIEQIEEGLKNVHFVEISIPSCLPFELFKLIYAYLKIDYNHRPEIEDITKILSKSGYSQKEIGLFVKIIKDRDKSYDWFKEFCYAFNLDYDTSIKPILIQLRQFLNS